MDVVYLRQVLDDIGKHTVEDFKNHLRNHNNTGKTYDSITYKVSDTILIISMDKAGKYIDEGRRPGKMPPINAISAWAKPKGLNPWAVAINIKKFGIKPDPFIFKYYDNIKANKDQLIKAYGLDINTNINDLLETMKLK